LGTLPDIDYAAVQLTLFTVQDACSYNRDYASHKVYWRND